MSSKLKIQIPEQWNLERWNLTSFWSLLLTLNKSSILIYCNYCCLEHVIAYCSVVIYLLKVNIINTRTRCEICSKLTIKTPERRSWRRSGVFIVNFEHISHLVLVLLWITLNIKLPAGWLSINTMLKVS